MFLCPLRKLGHGKSKCITRPWLGLGGASWRGLLRVEVQAGCLCRAVCRRLHSRSSLVHLGGASKQPPRGQPGARSQFNMPLSRYVGDMPAWRQGSLWGACGGPGVNLPIKKAGAGTHGLWPESTISRTRPRQPHPDLEGNVPPKTDGGACAPPKTDGGTPIVPLKLPKTDGGACGAAANMPPPNNGGGACGAAANMPPPNNGGGACVAKPNPGPLGGCE